jgi:hypothetical protein
MLRVMMMKESGKDECKDRGSGMSLVGVGSELAAEDERNKSFVFEMSLRTCKGRTKRLLRRSAKSGRLDGK